MNIKNKLRRASGIAAAAAVIGGLGLTGVASASTVQPTAVTSVSHHVEPGTVGQHCQPSYWWYGWDWGWYWGWHYGWYDGWYGWHYYESWGYYYGWHWSPDY